MLIPSIGLLEKLKRAKVGIWPELLDDDSVTLAAKVPQFAIKTLYRGAECSFSLSLLDIEKFGIFYLSLCIYDDTRNPLTIIQPVITKDEQFHFRNVFRSSTVSIHFFDELYNPILKTNCRFDSTLSSTAIEAVLAANISALDIFHSDIRQCIEFERAVVKGFDVIQKDLPSIQKGMSSTVTVNHVIPLTLTIEKPITGYAINTQGYSVEFTVTQENEGDIFEESLYLIFNDLYNKRVFLRPIVQFSRKVRELTDLLCFDSETNTICLVQAKAIASLKVCKDQPTQRRSASIKKDFKQASKQLIGAIRKIRSDSPIFNDKGDTIEILNRNIAPIHAIALVSDLHPSVNWRQIGKYLIQISESDTYRALFQVLDLQELQSIVANCTSTKDFHNLLLQRWAMMKLHGTAYVRGLSKGFCNYENAL
ncbi:conserved hypothetical protein [Candidatus Brocadia pituitae]|nr:conserved hypothetical protein [Candidatus Brocadia pituitae]